MEENPVPIQEQTKDKTKQRKAIDCEIKTRLIFSVVNDRLPIYQVMKNFNDLLFQAAILHKVKYSSAKHILRNYFNDSANFFSTQRKRKRKILCTNVFILIEACSGKITIKKQQLNSMSSANNGQISGLQQKTLSQLSYAICQEVQPLQKKIVKKAIRRIGKIQQDLDKLYSIIKRQHNEMTNLKELY
ncbi:unnamed protein product (macronuclear) [Paramecium tetraurelia]|uniref:Uncharacterized protein n=1 Tax=Paramecium tetraurelia TaxID=5888 RepID=A0BMN5_PARTE|nr:uncharacterized protein GSPATT00030438001 [Paramecium tetraurelia]CAK59802.1 unnamed protein product [Paramecium tetraurelia]|eukprot:XP_001427200.1 hypothetical protein (macronuclear) [Paramecium tetraurelia strain d4-2]